MMARVYIVLEDAHYEGTYICRVYADERDAAEEVRRLEKKHLDEYEGYRTSSFYYAEWKVREPQETNQTNQPKGKKSELPWFGGTPLPVSLNPMLLNPIPRHNDNKFPRNPYTTSQRTYLLPTSVMLGGAGCAASQRSTRQSIAYRFDSRVIWLWERVSGALLSDLVGYEVYHLLPLSVPLKGRFLALGAGLRAIGRVPLSVPLEGVMYDRKKAKKAKSLENF